MTILGNVVTGGKQAGQRIIIAAKEKVGKTTMAMQAPNALLIPLETDNVALSRTRHVRPDDVKTWGGVIALCEELRAAGMRGQLLRGSSLVWDSATALERLIHGYIMAADTVGQKQHGASLNMETALGGYGKAYATANEMFGQWLRYQDELARNGGINIIVTCHVFPTKVKDPTAGEYDQWDLLLHSPKNDKNYGKREYITQWADLIGFLHEPIFVQEAAAGQSMHRGISQNQGRLLAIDRAPAYVAGNRYGLTQSIPIPLAGGWNALAHAIHAQTGGAIDLFNRG